MNSLAFSRRPRISSIECRTVSGSRTRRAVSQYVSIARHHRPSAVASMRLMTGQHASDGAGHRSIQSATRARVASSGMPCARAGVGPASTNATATAQNHRHSPMGSVSSGLRQPAPPMIKHPLADDRQRTMRHRSPRPTPARPTARLPCATSTCPCMRPRSAP